MPKTVMITGAAGGFGMAFAHRFAAAGCKLILTSRKQDQLVKLAAACKVPVHVFTADMSDRQGLEKGFASIPEEFRAIDLLINNAGGAFGMEPAYEAKLDDWEDMIAANNYGLVICTHFVLPGMVERGSGHIINIGSTAGNYPYPGGHVYCAVKAFTKQLSLALRCDLTGTGVRVTNIEPGVTKTDFALNRFKGDKAKADAVYANADLLTAGDVAEAVFWAATQPPHVNVNRLEITATAQATGPYMIHRKK